MTPGTVIQEEPDRIVIRKRGGATEVRPPTTLYPGEPGFPPGPTRERVPTPIASAADYGRPRVRDDPLERREL
jgi:hypothetical protein